MILPQHNVSTKNTEKHYFRANAVSPKIIFKPHRRNVSQGQELKPYLAALPQQAKILAGISMGNEPSDKSNH